MWVRKQIDIGPSDLLFGLRSCFCLTSRQALEDKVCRQWERDQTLVCLSVRSGFDLLMSSADWPAGSEVLMSGMTIPDMPRIVRENGHRPIGLDVDAKRLSLSLPQLQAAVTPRTKAIVVAHLFGGLCDLDPVIEVAREHDLLVIEDCAQAYVGPHFHGDPRADVSMFSFGAIKTNTSLGGGVLVVRHPQWLDEVRQRHGDWPAQTRLAYLQRLLKYGGVKLISTRVVAGAVARGLELVGRDHDQLAVRLSRGFSGGNFFHRIRHQPSALLLQMMARRFRRFDQQTIVDRTRRGRRLESALEDSVDVLGCHMQRPTYWVFAILVDQPDPFIRHLWQEGFDATNRCSLQPVESERDPESFDADGEHVASYASEGESGKSNRRGFNSDELAAVRFMLKHVVFLPVDPSMPPRELRRLARVVREAQPRRPNWPAGPADQPEASRHQPAESISS